MEIEKCTNSNVKDVATSGLNGRKPSPGSVRSVVAPIGIRRGKELTQKIVRELFDYNPETGELIRRVSTSNRVKVGDVTGCPNSNGYLSTMVDSTAYSNHRLIWLHVHGYFPESQIDHINRVRTDNRLENLREVSASCNTRNASQRSSNTSGVQGIHWLRRDQKWRAQIQVGKKTQHLGLHTSFLEAVCHRLAAEQCVNWGSCDSNSPAYQYVTQSKLATEPQLAQREIIPK